MAAIRKILFIHQDELLARTLSEPLAGQGYGLLFAHNLDEALSLADEAELLLIDASADPVALCPRLKDEGVAAPLLLLAGLSTPEVSCVDERMAKPVRLAQLAARIEALLNRPMPVESLIRFAGLTLHPLARLVETEQGRRIPLTEKETAILTHLHQAGPEEVGREELLGQVWGYSAEASTHTVETHIYRLRRKLGEGAVMTGALGYRLGTDEA
jgi:DNA-binding response OmpR family regulator